MNEPGCVLRCFVLFRSLCLGVGCLLTAAVAMTAATARAEKVDLVIANATVYDGTGEPPFVGFIAIQGEKIQAVGTGPGPSAEWRIDAQGLVAAPGFIDLHTHSDSGIVSRKSRAAINYVLQGVTTSVTGNCGMGPTNVQAFYDKVDLAGAGTNVAHLLPQGALRLRVVGNTNRPASADELDEMRRLARLAMEEGAWGMSTGLIYTPSTYASTEELIEIAREIAAGNGIYASHIRGEEAELLQSVQEAIRIGQEAALPTHISHFKVKGRPNWGALRLAIQLIEQARAAGAVVTADQDPYIASSTSLEATIFPAWARSGGREQLVKRLRDPEQGPQIRQFVSASLQEKDDGEQIVLARFVPQPEWVGLNLKQIAAQSDKTPLEIAEFIMQQGGASIVNFAMNEADVRQAMTLPWVATASDGSVNIPGPTRPHPRSFGTFPRKIGYYSLQEEVLPLAQAIRSASGLPADILGMTDRGYLQPGLAADVVLFDPQTFLDRSTFEEPFLYPEGMHYVFVNGTPAVAASKPTGALAGRALRKSSPVISVADPAP